MSLISNEKTKGQWEVGKGKTMAKTGNGLGGGI
jgi:hypothetical protein